jgi:hypothetical protein
VTEIPSELPANVTPLRSPPKDPTAAERKRRSRAKKRRKRRVTPVTPGAAAGHGLGHVFDHGHGAQHIGAASIAGRSSAICDAAKAAGEVSQIIEFPASKRLTDVTDEPVTRAPLPDISADNSRPEIAPSPVSLPIADTLAYTIACGHSGQWRCRRSPCPRPCCTVCEMHYFFDELSEGACLGGRCSPSREHGPEINPGQLPIL